MGSGDMCNDNNDGNDFEKSKMFNCCISRVVGCYEVVIRIVCSNKCKFLM